MTIQDCVPITTLERAVSADFNTESALNNRSIVELARSLTEYGIMGGIPSWLDRTHVAKGLFLQLSLGVPVMSTGMLLQNVAGGALPVPAPGTFDSSYRFGLNLSTEILTDPWDTTDRWWLLQARVERITTLSEVRDIYDPATQTFAPGAAIDKRYESQIGWAWKAGTPTTIPAADAGYAPIAALWRPIAGGAIATDDLVQLATQLDDIVPVWSDNYVNRRSGKRFLSAAASATQYFNLAGEIAGARLYAHSETGFQIRHARFCDTAYAADLAQDGYWWYVYLAQAPSGRIPSGLYGTGLDHRGLLIISRLRPNDEGRNSGALNVPLPIGGVVAAGEAVHVGIFRTDGVGNNIHYINIADDGIGLVDKQQFSFVAPGDKLFPMNLANTFQNGAHNLATTGPNNTEDVPLGVHLRCYMEPTQLDVTAVGLAANILLSLVGTETRRVILSFRSLHGPVEFELTPVGGAVNLTFTVTCLDTTGGAIAWNAANVQNNEWVAGLYGVRF